MRNYITTNIIRHPTNPKTGIPGSYLKTAFTLTELLVVITIISVLAGLLLPALSNVRKQGRSIVCMNNLRQVGSAMRIYSNDYNGFVPGWEMDAGYTKPWHLTLMRGGYISTNEFLVGKRSLLVCPDQEPKTFQETAYTYGLWWNKLGPSPETAFRIDALPNPAESPVLADSRRVPCIGGMWYQSYYLMEGSGGGQSISEADGTGEKLIHLRHLGKGNVLFGDGHVSAINGQYLKTIGWDWISTIP